MAKKNDKGEIEGEGETLETTKFPAEVTDE
jgi:hypothetical protein